MPTTKHTRRTTVTLAIDTDCLEALCWISWRDRVPVPAVVAAAITGFIGDWTFRREFQIPGVALPDGYPRRRRRDDTANDEPPDWTTFEIQTAKPFAEVLPDLAAAITRERRSTKTGTPRRHVTRATTGGVR